MQIILSLVLAQLAAVLSFVAPTQRGCGGLGCGGRAIRVRSLTHRRQQAAAAAPPQAGGNWDFVECAFVITTSNADGPRRLQRAREVLRSAGLDDELVEARAFPTDDADRVRGCYMSHIAVLEECRRRLPPGGAALVLEDNVAASPRIESRRAAETARRLLASGDPQVGRCASSHVDWLPMLCLR